MGFMSVWIGKKVQPSGGSKSVELSVLCVGLGLESY